VSYRVLPSVFMWVIAAALVVAIVTVIDLAKSDGPVFIVSNGPISEVQVRQKMIADGWTNVLITREGRYFQVMGSNDQQTAHLVVDSQTGRLRGDDDD